MPQKEPSELVAHFAEEISSLVGNPRCTTCFGKFYTGIAELPDGRKHLLTCRCARMGPTEYARLRRDIENKFAELEDWAEMRFERLERLTFWGFFAWAWRKVRGNKRAPITKLSQEQHEAFWKKKGYGKPPMPPIPPHPSLDTAIRMDGKKPT